jgi:predicted CopG family antitoxin
MPCHILVTLLLQWRDNPTFRPAFRLFSACEVLAMTTPTTKPAPATESRTIRVSNRVYDRLGELSRRRHSTISETIASLIDQQERRDFFAQMRDGYAKLRADAGAWRETQSEQQEWDATLSDGLAVRGDE